VERVKIGKKNATTHLNLIYIYNRLTSSTLLHQRSVAAEEKNMAVKSFVAAVITLERFYNTSVEMHP